MKTANHLTENKLNEAKHVLINLNSSSKDKQKAINIIALENSKKIPRNYKKE